MQKTKTLTEGAIMVAMATVLSMVTVIQLPNGGAVTAASMVPIILMSFRHNVKWGVFTSVVYALIQMMIGFYPPPTQDFLSFALVVLLDYVIAFGVLGLAGVIGGKLPGGKTVQIIGGSAIVVAIRFVCHFLSGILIWSSFAPEGQPVWIYSLLYNGSYMGLELIISVAVMVIIARSFKKLFV